MNTRRSSLILLMTLHCGLCTCSVAAESVAPGINDRYNTEEGRKTAEQICEDPNRHIYQRGPGGLQGQHATSEKCCTTARALTC